MRLACRLRFLFFGALLLCMAGFACVCPGQNSRTQLDLNKLPFFLGREYFALRSGRAQLLAQADRADLGPAFTFLLFDAENPGQNASKDRAFNFVPGEGVESSALVVELGGYPFTALGHTTQTGWVMEDGIPAAQAVWWAGGVRVTERIAALSTNGVFRRSIALEGANLVGDESVKLRLSIPAGHNAFSPADSIVAQNCGGATLAIAVVDKEPARILTNQGALEIGPLAIAPNGVKRIETFLSVQIPAVESSSLVTMARDVDTTRQRWAETSSINTKDQTVEDIFDHARFGLPGLVADDGVMDAGIFEYGAQWVRDSSNVALGALHAGHFELARGILVHILTKMINRDGATMIAGGFNRPDMEEFDQMGELIHCLREYRDWTGDGSLVREHREQLLALVERPLQPQFRDKTGMVHDRCEFWERSFDDAYELAYQTYIILGLREAAQLAPDLGAEDRATRWRQEAERIERAMLAHPTRSLVRDGRLVKRRNVTGEIAEAPPASYAGFQSDVPLNTEKHHHLLPDASQALPIALGVVDPRSDLARQTLDDLEPLWNARWSGGGYDRYHTSSQPDQPGPWPFATCFILRAQHDAGLFDRSRRSLEWLNTVQGGRTGAWFEEIPVVRSQTHACGLVPWTSAEIALFVVRHYLGVRFEYGCAVIRPALYPGSPPVSANLRFRQGRLRLQVDGSGAIRKAWVNGKQTQPGPDGALRLPAHCADATAVIQTR